MKKFRSIVGVFLLFVVFVCTGCGNGGAKVFDYLKKTKDFVGNPGYNGGKYTASLTVNGDLSYSIFISDEKTSYDALKNYTATGTQMQYLGRREESHSSTTWGVTTGWTTYIHVIKLPEATVEENGNIRTFYLVATSDSKYADTFTIKLETGNSEYGENDIGNIGDYFYGGYALKAATK